MNQIEVPLIKVFQPECFIQGIYVYSLIDAVDIALWQGTNAILIDFSNVPSLDQITLGCLVFIYYQTKSINRNLYLCSVTEQGRNFIQSMGFDWMFNIFADRADFEKFIWQQASNLK